MKLVVFFLVLHISKDVLQVSVGPLTYRDLQYLFGKIYIS